MEIANLTAFMLISLTLACTPGADWAYIISSALKNTSFAPAVWGLLSGYLIHTALIVCGLAAIVASNPQVLSWLTLLGAGYLLWLGISTARSWRSARFLATEPAAGMAGDLPETVAKSSTGGAVATAVEARRTVSGKVQARHQFTKGLLTSATNPKALLLYLALIPQFISPQAPWSLEIQTGVLGLVHFGISIGVYFTIAYAARLLLGSRPAAARIVTLVSGLIMIALGVALLAEKFFVL
ncbi:LysE family translocator [Glutamicibacter endophyticus]